MPVLIRELGQADLPAAAALLDELGYGLDPEEVAGRFGAVRAAPGHALWAAVAGGKVLGLVHVFARPALEKPPEAVVQALVVDAAHRGRGVGRRLMAAAEAWARERGYRSLSLATEISRDDAQAFYTALGYVIAATSHQMRKKLG